MAGALPTKVAARWLGGLVAWWPTNILSNALQTLRTAQFDTHIHTGTDARTTNTISQKNYAQKSTETKILKIGLAICLYAITPFTCLIWTREK